MAGGELPRSGLVSFKITQQRSEIKGFSGESCQTPGLTRWEPPEGSPHLSSWVVEIKFADLVRGRAARSQTQNLSELAQSLEGTESKPRDTEVEGAGATLWHLVS